MNARTDENQILRDMIEEIVGIGEFGEEGKMKTNRVVRAVRNINGLERHQFLE